jgi:predicted nucleic acid-binding protein
MPADEMLFADTNVLRYSVDTSVPVKRDQPGESGAVRLSWQVLQEFYVNAERKEGLPSLAAPRLVETFAQWQPWR